VGAKGGGGEGRGKEKGRGYKQCQKPYIGEHILKCFISFLLLLFFKTGFPGCPGIHSVH
jgi:hypothetical protein